MLLYAPFLSPDTLGPVMVIRRLTLFYVPTGLATLIFFGNKGYGGYETPCCALAVPILKNPEKLRILGAYQACPVRHSPQMNQMLYGSFRRGKLPEIQQPEERRSVCGIHERMFRMNRLYYGDCLTVMQQMPPGSVGLFCRDPPFNSNRSCNAIYRDGTPVARSD